MATSTPASSHHANALRASSLPIGYAVPPTIHPSPPLTAGSRNWQGRQRQNESDVRREVRPQVPRGASRETMSQRESMQYDVVVVGAGPAGLAAAIRLNQRAAESG